MLDRGREGAQSADKARRWWSVSKAELERAIQRAVDDESFRTQVRSDPTTALRGYDLSDAEREAITSGDEAQLTELGVEATLSKGVRYV